MGLLPEGSRGRRILPLRGLVGVVGLLLPVWLCYLGWPRLLVPLRLWRVCFQGSLLTLRLPMRLRRLWLLGFALTVRLLRLRRLLVPLRLPMRLGCLWHL